MPERGNTGFKKIHEIASRMIEADPAHANGWEEVITFVDFSARQGRISKTAQDPINETLQPLEDTIYRHKYFDFDIQGHSVLVEGERIELTRMNFDLLSYLVLKKNTVVGRLELLDKVWENFPSPQTVDVHIFKVRTILRAGRKNIPEIIRTVRGVGYMLNDEQTDPNASGKS